MVIGSGSDWLFLVTAKPVTMAMATWLDKERAVWASAKGMAMALITRPDVSLSFLDVADPVATAVVLFCQ